MKAYAEVLRVFFPHMEESTVKRVRGRSEGKGERLPKLPLLNLPQYRLCPAASRQTRV